MLRLCVLIDLFHEERMQKLNLILVLSIVNYSKCCIVPCKLSQYCTIWGYWYWYQEFLTAAKWESLAKTFKTLKNVFFVLQWKRLSSKSWRDLSGSFISLSNSLLTKMIPFEGHLIKLKLFYSNKTILQNFWQSKFSNLTGKKGNLGWEMIVIWDNLTLILICVDWRKFFSHLLYFLPFSEEHISRVNQL